MIRTNLTQQTESRKITQVRDNFSVLEYFKDLSNDHSSAIYSYYASEMGVHKRQVIINLNGNGVIIQAGAMQMMLGNIQAETNVRGVGDFAKKLVGSKLTGETAIKPKYAGVGSIVLEPTFKHILLENLDDWGGGLIIEDGIFLACADSVNLKVVARSNLSSAVLGGEGLFNSCLSGRGIVALESPVPRDELIVIDLENDVVKIDGSMAIAWTPGLEFTVERTTKTLIGSAASGEGLVNVYRGTGRVLVAPVECNPGIATVSNNSQTGASTINLFGKIIN